MERYKHCCFIMAALFTLGKFVIGNYLEQSNMAIIYGAAASVIIIMQGGLPIL